MSSYFEVTDKTSKKVIGIRLGEDEWRIVLIDKYGSELLLMDDVQLEKYLLSIKQPKNSVYRIVGKYR